MIPQFPDNQSFLELQQLRRKFHHYPETKWSEFWTSDAICQILEALGYEVVYGRDLYQQDLRAEVPSSQALDTAWQKARQRCDSSARLEKMRGGFTGVIARIGNGSGPNIGFRFDIDGLPIREATTAEHLPAAQGFSSENGNMHACGHDGHISIGLGLAAKLSQNIERLNGNYYLLFQPAEEGGLGGRVFSQYPAVSGFDYFLALHLGLLAARKLVCGLEFLFAKTYRISFRGRSSHSAHAPHQGHNALLAAATAVTNLYAISRHSQGASRVNIGNFHSNNAINVISDQVDFEMEVRGETATILDYMDASAHRVLLAAAQMYSAEVASHQSAHLISCPTSESLRQRLASLAQEIGIPSQAIINRQLIMGCEDAPYIMEQVQQHGGQATYFCLGSPTAGGHHNERFDFDEDLLPWGVQILWQFVLSESSIG